jgi:hypothetical protein
VQAKRLFEKARKKPSTRNRCRSSCAAYDKATVGLNDCGLPSVVREMIAVRVIAFGLKGERDPDRLCAAALAAVGITP